MINVLVVEDDAIARSVICAIIKSGGYNAMEADGGESALQICENANVKIDLILTDFKMPNMNGVELIKRLRIDHADMRAVLMSGFANDTVDTEGGKMTNLLFMRKPFLPQELLTMIRTALS